MLIAKMKERAEHPGNDQLGRQSTKHTAAIMFRPLIDTLVVSQPHAKAIEEEYSALPQLFYPILVPRCSVCRILDRQFCCL